MKADIAGAANRHPGKLEIAPMTIADVRAVMRIEALAFTPTWPMNAFASEINDNKLAYYYVGRVGGEIVAYGGIWVILEESHVTTIAVHPNVRGKRYGEELLLFLLRSAIERGASWMTLEVRESNHIAQSLYRKYGFTVVSTRRAYYSDNMENAFVMWAGHLGGALYQRRLDALEAALEEYIARGRT